MAKEAPSAASPTWTVEIVWEPGCLGGPAQTVVDVLRLVNAIAAVQAPAREPPLRWRWVRSDGRRVPPSLLTPAPHPEPHRGPREAPPGAAGPARRRDAAQVIVVPGWHAHDGPEVDQWVSRSRALLPRLQAAPRAGGAVLGVYTGVALLSAAGLLDGRQATAPWPFMAAMLRQAGAARTAGPADIRWVDAPGWAGDRGVWTCAAPAAATEALLHLLAQGPHAALVQAARDVLLPSARRQAAAVAHARSADAPPASSRVPAGIVERARQWLVEHLADPYDADALARAAATSARTLARHFQAAHGVTPHQYLEQLRVERACLLLQTTYLTAEAIARASGMPHPGTFRRVFVAHTGERPGDYRRRYRLRTQRPRWTGNGPPPRRG